LKSLEVQLKQLKDQATLESELRLVVDEWRNLQLGYSTIRYIGFLENGVIGHSLSEWKSMKAKSKWFSN